MNLSPENAELLKQEAALLWDLNHHSLPAMKDFFEAPDGSYIIAMTFVPGRNIEQIIKKHKAIHPEDVCWITQRSLHALYYLHSNGVVHSDVKPQNLIVHPKDHNAILVDYGLSSFRPKADTEAIGYTEVFAAPELTQGRPPIPESDLYGLGLTMMYALGGDVMAKAHAPGVPDPIRVFIDDFLRYDPTDRPNWEKGDLVKRLSDIRLEVFGRRHSI